VMRCQTANQYQQPVCNEGRRALTDTQTRCVTEDEDEDEDEEQRPGEQANRRRHRQTKNPHRHPKTTADNNRECVWTHRHTAAAAAAAPRMDDVGVSARTGHEDEGPGSRTGGTAQRDRGRREDEAVSRD